MIHKILKVLFFFAFWWTIKKRHKSINKPQTVTFGVRQKRAGFALPQMILWISADVLLIRNRERKSIVMRKFHSPTAKAGSTNLITFVMERHSRAVLIMNHFFRCSESSPSSTWTTLKHVKMFFRYINKLRGENMKCCKLHQLLWCFLIAFCESVLRRRPADLWASWTF